MAVLGAPDVRRSNSPFNRLRKPFLAFFKNSDYQNRVLAIVLALMFFVAPSMASGGMALYQLFYASPPELPRDAQNHVMVPETIDQFVPRLVVTGIFFCIGIFVILYASRGFPDLENTLTIIGVFTVAGGGLLSGTMTYKCLQDLSCETFLFVAGLICILALTLISFILPAGVGKKFGWFSVVFIPVLIYEVLRWTFYLFALDQPIRATEGVLKSTILLFITVGLAILFALAGGWPGPQSKK